MTGTVFSGEDHAWMARAIGLAELGLWTTSPNPRVGCVLVRAGELVGEGWHRRAGEPHAEVHALREAGERANGATAYVTLEPCSHFGRTPPCAEALIGAGVRRVVAAMEDPNPLVKGKGLARLRAAGVEVSSGLLGDAAAALNAGFISRMVRGRPWVRLKLAASLDGRTALQNGLSQWITGPLAREDGHRWRARACAILTGSGTVLADDPQLTVRLEGVSRQPLRVVVDSACVTPVAARILAGGALLATVRDDPLRTAPLKNAGAEIVCLPDAAGKRVNLSALLTLLGERGINELHVEAGPGLNGALLRAGLVDECLLYLAPSVLGQLARGMFDLPPLGSLSEQIRFDYTSVDRLGADLRLIARAQGTVA